MDGARLLQRGDAGGDRRGGWAVGAGSLGELSGDVLVRVSFVSFILSMWVGLGCYASWSNGERRCRRDGDAVRLSPDGAAVRQHMFVERRDAIAAPLPLSISLEDSAGGLRHSGTIHGGLTLRSLH